MKQVSNVNVGRDVYSQIWKKNQNYFGISKLTRYHFKQRWEMCNCKYILCASESVYSSSNSNFRAQKNDTSFCNLVLNWMRVESKPFELWRNCGKTAFFIKRRNLAECTIEKVLSKELRMRYIIYYSISGPKKSRYKFMSSCKVWH